VIDKCRKLWTVVVVFSMLIVSMAAIAPGASAAPVASFEVTGPKFGTSPMYVNILTNFTLTASEPSDIWYRWDDTPLTKYTEPFHAVVIIGSAGGAPPLPMDLDEGPHTLYYNCTGEAPKSLPIFLDNLVPITTLGYVGTHYSGDYQFVESDTQITLASTDAGSAVKEIRYAINNGPETVYTLPFTVLGLGLQTIVYWSTDNLGNLESQRSITVSVDNDAPDILISLGTPQLTVSGAVHIGATTPIAVSFTDISGLSSYGYKIDGGAWTDYNGPFAIPTEGHHTIFARATDNMGHASAEISLPVTVDSIAPVVTVTGTSGDTIQVGLGDKIVLQATDTGVGECIISYSFDGGITWKVYTQPLQMLGDTNITYYATDALGNSATQLTVRVYVSETSSSWRLYLGIALIVGGVLVAISTFFMFRKVPEAESSVKKKALKSREEEPEPKKKNHKRKR